MKVENIAPTADGEGSQITLSITVKDAKKIMKLLQEGKLAELGITDAVITPTGISNSKQQSWTHIEQSKRAKSDDSPTADLP